MSDLIFTLESMEAVKDVMQSCKMLMPAILTENQKYFLKVLEKGCDIPTLEFLKNLPDKENDKLFGNLFYFAGKKTAKRISEILVWIFFADSMHIKKSAEDIAQMVIPENMRYMLQIGHTLLPAKVVVTIKNKEEKINALYENNGGRVMIKNVGPGRFEGKISLEDFVLIHYASVLEVRPDELLIKAILATQAKDKILMAACEKTEVIDYDEIYGKICA